MRLTRRQFVGVAGASTLAAAGVYELVDRLSPPPRRAAIVPPHLPEQHILQNLRIVMSDGVEVFVPPLHSEVVTATLRVEHTSAALADARSELDHQLGKLDDRFPGTPSGLGVAVGWGLPYFRRYVAAQARRGLPVDVRASSASARLVHVLEDAFRFPSDPEGLLLEDNDVAVLLRSDKLAHIEEAAGLLFGGRNSIFDVTSIRRGFVGGGFDGAPSLPKLMATAAHIPGAHLVPDSAELFLGFTSTQKQQPGHERIANLETLGYTDVGPNGYFAHGTHMHLSHLFEDLEAWYERFTPQQRIDSAFRPGLELAPGTLTVDQGPGKAESANDVARDFRNERRIGHSGSIQPASRLQHDVVGPDRTLYQRGTPIPHRADFNTLDHPFAWTANPGRDRFDKAPSAGLHFVVFNPSSDDFNRGRLAMDGRLPGGRVLNFDRSHPGPGLNDVIRSTHRQNFLVPPRIHRSFPLSELDA